MLDTAFQYDCTKGEWMPCEQAAYIHEDIEKLPHTLIVAYQQKIERVSVSESVVMIVDIAVL